MQSTRNLTKKIRKFGFLFSFYDGVLPNLTYNVSAIIIKYVLTLLNIKKKQFLE